MTRNQAKKIFEKYNPADAVVRCPSGKAKMRKSLDLYTKAAVNLYGIIRREEFVEIFNSQNKEQITTDEVYVILLPNVLKDKWYGFYKEYIVHYLVLENFDLVDYLEREQAGKPRYLPSKEQFLQYEWEEHEDTDHWDETFDYMCDTFGDSDNTMDCFDEIKEYLTLGFGIKEIGKILDEFNIVLEDQKQAQKLFNILMDAANNTRKWQNKGYTPNEMMKIMADTQPKEPVVNQRTKIGPNERCPCGSSKKYKKCCGFVKSTGLAHLSYSECELFYNTWYKLLLLVNLEYSVIKTENMPIESLLNDDVKLYEISKKLWENPHIISELINEGNHLTDKEIELFQLWEKHHIMDKFVLFKYEPEYAVFMHSIDEKNTKLYAVKGLKTSIAEMMHRKLPIMLNTVLLPFEGKIVYDSFISSYHLSFGGGIMEVLEKDYKNAMESFGVITKIV